MKIKVQKQCPVNIRRIVNFANVFKLISIYKNSLQICK